jgi:RNA-binding protein YhbY
MTSAIEFSGSDPGPAPTPQVRRGLLGRGHQLKARLTLGREGLTEAFAAHIRQCFEHTDLLKVRINVDDRDDARQMATALAVSVPCHLVQRTGRVALLYRCLPEADD